MKFDAFLSYVAADSSGAADQLFKALQAKDLSVWWDEKQILIGDSIRSAIDSGIQRSRCGIVLLSPSFFDRHWPTSELDGLAQQAASQGNPLFPVLVGLSIDQLREHSPSLAGVRCLDIASGADNIASEIARALNRGNPFAPPVFPVHAQSVPRLELAWPEMERNFEDQRGGRPALLISCRPSQP